MHPDAFTHVAGVTGAGQMQRPCTGKSDALPYEIKIYATAAARAVNTV